MYKEGGYGRCLKVLLEIDIEILAGGIVWMPWSNLMCTLSCALQTESFVFGIYDWHWLENEYMVLLLVLLYLIYDFIFKVKLFKCSNQEARKICKIFNREEVKQIFISPHFIHSANKQLFLLGLWIIAHF